MTGSGKRRFALVAALFLNSIAFFGVHLRQADAAMTCPSPGYSCIATCSGVVDGTTCEAIYRHFNCMTGDFDCERDTESCPEDTSLDQNDPNRCYDEDTGQGDPDAAWCAPNLLTCDMEGGIGS